ncbi:YybS family protein [Breznakiella homolactica]|uniref:DUF2232 domain-containing protein n=1 Tax=Breznakiella homolactica TaxID=2798577 RepID=A0A7T7XKW0_9SPIR|nr:YybS family protein [Breznakiella homolactica]QQO08077.1 YybS family protein [Breznakiella homolactica]
MFSRNTATQGLVPALICAVSCVVIIRTGFLSLFFLLPLGIAAYCYSRRIAWFAGAAAIAGNTLAGIILGIISGYSIPVILLDAGYFTLLVVVFLWIVAPPVNGPAFMRISGAYRIVAGSVLVFAGMIPAAYLLRDSSGMYKSIMDQAEMLASLYRASMAGDAVERSISEQYVTAEAILQGLSYVAVRGAGIASCMVFLFFSRQAALIVTWFVRHERPGGNLMAFHAAPKMIWVLSISLLGVILGLSVKIAALEIAAWNILVICAMIYLAQGGGILLFFLSRPGVPPMLRFLLNFFLIMLIFSPGINIGVLVILVLLGIAENWIPFRVPKINGSSSTPGM